MSKRVLCVAMFVLVMMFIFDPAYCRIANDQIRAASESFIDTVKDWMPAIIGGGLVGSGICLFANNFKMGIAGLAGTGFLYAARAFVDAGDGALINMASELLSL